MGWHWQRPQHTTEYIGHIYLYIWMCANFSYLPSTLHRQCEYKQYKEEEEAENRMKKNNEKSKAHFQLINEIN